MKRSTAITGRVCQVTLEPGRPVHVRLMGRNLYFCPHLFEAFAETIAAAAQQLAVQRAEALFALGEPHEDSLLH